MNHLAHFKLAGGEPHLIAGALLADQVKGRLVGRLDARIEQGVRIHREIDGFTDAHPLVKRSYGRLPDHLRRYCPLLVDVIYDHILAVDWPQLHPLPLEQFARDTFAAFDHVKRLVPPTLLARARRMEESRLLLRYRELDTIEGVLRHLGTRLSRANPVADALPPLVQELEGLREDFHAFLPLVERHVAERLDKSTNTQPAYRSKGRAL